VTVGIQTTVNTSMRTIHNGMGVWLDPNPDIKWVAGTPTPAIEVTGTKGVFFPATRGMLNVGVETMCTNAKDAARTMLGNSKFQEKLRAASTLDAMLNLFRESAKEYCNLKCALVDMPLRAYLPLWSVWNFTQRVKDGSMQVPTEAMRFKLWRSGLAMTLVLLRENAQMQSVAARRQLSHLPAGVAPRAAAHSMADNDSSVFSNKLTDLLATAAMQRALPMRRYFMLLEADGLINTHVENQLQMFTHEMHACASKFYLGRALKTAEPGQPLKILIGH